MSISETDMPEAVKELLMANNFAQLATVNADGTPHIDTVWIDYQQGMIWVATTMATKKAKNAKAKADCYMVVTNRDNPYEQVQMKLKLQQLDDDAEYLVCDRISEKYTGKPFVQRHHKQRVAMAFAIVSNKYHLAKV